MQTENIQRAAAMLVGARRDRKRLSGLPADLVPASLDEAYAVQDGVVALLGPLGGWKLGAPTGEPIPKCAPVVAAHIHASPARLGASALLVAPEIEVEIAVRFARDMPPRATPYGSHDVAAAIGSIHPALEVISSRYENRRAVPPLAVAADGQGNGAVVYGPGVSNWRAVEFGTAAMTLTFDGKQVASVPGGPSTADVLKVLAWLANHVAARDGGFRAGQLVITGARITTVPVPAAGATVVAEIQGIGTTAATIA